MDNDIVLTTKYGKVRLHAVNAGRVGIDVGDETGEAHHNDDRPTLLYRDKEYIGGIYFKVEAAKVGDISDSSISQRWDVRAPKTYLAAMAGEIRKAAQEYIDAHPEILTDAERAYVGMDLARAASRLEEANKAAEQAQAEVDRLTALLASIAN